MLAKHNVIFSSIRVACYWELLEIQDYLQWIIQDFAEWGVPEGLGVGYFFTLEKSKIARFFQTRKVSKNVKKSMKNLQFSENFQIYIQKFQWKTDFLPIISRGARRGEGGKLPTPKPKKLL